MSLNPGTRLGPYEIVSPLGAGGMGEVHRARDTKLGREVAIKILPDLFAQDPERLARFEREARTLAALNHPNIAHIYGVEDTAGVHALVMELVEGEDLSQRLSHGAMPIDEALPIARQIAEALEAAHEHGIIHRDLKPANVKVRDDGVVKVLDFGLAKALAPDGASAAADAMNSPTLTARATQLGVILGTAAYMAPEQARGKAVDRRADVWAFGVVLYEMLTGERAFRGENVSDTLAAVLTREVSLTSLPTDTPRPLRALVRDCLIRDPKQRLRDIGDARLVLDRIIAGAPDDVVSPATMPVAVVSPWRRAGPRMLAGVAAAATLVALAVSVVHFREASPHAAERMRFEFPFPDGMRPTRRSVPSLSPDGRHLAFVATAADGRRRLWIRTLDGEAKPREGTDGAWGSPFWSRDSRVVVYLDNRLAAAPTLRKIDAFDGPSQVVCSFPRQSLWGGFWTADDQIVFGSCCGTGAGSSGLYRVAASGGGVAAPLTTMLEGERSHGYPVPLPDGTHFLYSRGDGVSVGSLDAAPERQASATLLPDRTNVAYVPSGVPGRGYVLFGREATLYAQPFDEGRLELTGDPQPVAQHVSLADPDQFWIFAAAANGVVIYQEGGFLQNRQRLWLDRHGQTLRQAGESGFLGGVWLSPDGSQVAYARREGQHEDLWLTDVERRSDARFTTNAARNWNATWSPDARHIAYASAQRRTIDLYLKAVAGAGGEELVLKNGVPLDWSSDGHYVLFTRDSDLWLLNDPRASSERTPLRLTETTFAEGDSRFSPVAPRWMAVQSDFSGRSEIYLQSFDVSPTGAVLGGMKMVSASGGTEPRWSRDGRELFYVSADQRMMAVPMTPGPVPHAGDPKPVFRMPPAVSWDVDPTGQRFLFIMENAPPPFTVVVNWQAGLKK